MPSLLELQRGLRSSLLTGVPVAPAEIVGGKIGAAARLAIYRNNLIGNLTRALQLGYPAIERLVGKNFFAAAAERFIVAAPPNAADLNRYGEGFADFLAAFEAAADLPYLPDVARLEWAVSRALHAAPALPLAHDALGVVPPHRQADVCFSAHPTLSLLCLDYPARAIWQAALTVDTKERDARFAAIDIQAGGEALAVLRHDGGLDIAVLPDAAFAFLNALTAGCPLGEALDGIAADDAALWMADFLTRGFFAGFALPDEDAPLTQGPPS
jgi:hypothetical protein